MRLPLGSTDVSASGGTVELVGRIGEEWRRLLSAPRSPEAAVALLEDQNLGVHQGPDFERAEPSGSDAAVRFARGDEILWRYGGFIEAARVIRDDAQGLVVWIPSGSARLESVPADGRAIRDVPLTERFSVPWRIRQSTWTGPGIVRVAPTGRPWSVWFFRESDGTPAGAYVNVELPHRRVGGAVPGIFSRDLVLDLWIDAEHAGSEDIWLKDADELDAAVVQGRFTADQADAVRAMADHAAAEFIIGRGWPLDEPWESWAPDAAMDMPVTLPASVVMDAARGRAGASGTQS
ncbi:MAG: DUF402 domain-containing protein [Microbacterium sp.]